MQRRVHVHCIAFVVGYASFGAVAAGQEGGHGHDHGHTHGGSNPKMVIPTPIHDYGDVWLGGEVEHHFEVRNEGTEPLELLAVKPGCGCTVARHDKVIAPGETGRITTVIKTLKLGNGSFSKTVDVISNDPTNRTSTLTLRGTCHHFVVADPTLLDFGEIKPREDVILKSILTAHGKQDIRLQLERSNVGRQFEAELVERTPGQVFELVIRGVPPYVAGSLREIVTIRTSVPQQPEIKLTVQGKVLERLDVYPTQITILRPEDSEFERKVTFSNYGNHAVQLLEATIDDPQVRLSTVEVRPGGRYEVTAHFPKGYTPGQAGKTLRLRIDDPLTAELEVPVRGNSRPPHPAEMLVGNVAPDVDLRMHSGNTLNPSRPGEVVVLFFYVSWCPNCAESLPRMERLGHQYKDKGVRFVAFNMDKRLDPENPPPDPRLARRYFTEQQGLDKLAELGVTFDVFFDHEQAVGRPTFKINAWPALFVIDRNGRVVRFHTGQVFEERVREDLYTVDDLTALLDELVANGGIGSSPD